MGHNINKGQDIVLVPQKGNFKCDLEEGASQFSTYDKNFEMNLDFRHFSRENVRVTITKSGAMHIFASNETEGEEDEYNEEIFIPESERVLLPSFACQMNSDGILRISANLKPPEPEVQKSRTVADSKTTIIKKSSEGKVETRTTVVGGSEVDIDVQQDAEEKPEKNEIKFTKGQIKTKEKKIKGAKTAVETTLAQPEESVKNYIIRPMDSDFDCDISLIQDRPEFRVTAEKTFRTFVNTSRYKPEDVKIEVIKNQIVRVEVKPEDQFSRGFLKEIPIPFGCKAEDIDVTTNDRGILRLLANTEESRQIARGKAVIVSETPTANSATSTIIKPTIEAIGSSSTTTKLNESTPWGERVATATTQGSSEFSTQNFGASVAAKDYSPEDIQIKISDGWVTIVGKKQGSGFGENSFQNKTFTKRIQIPENINPESIVCAFDSSTGLVNISTVKT